MMPRSPADEALLFGLAPAVGRFSALNPISLANVFPLAWSHYVRLFAVENPPARALYDSVPSGDLATVVAHSVDQRVPPIILYDNVPGGAGLVSRLEQENAMKQCLMIARTRVAGDCGCDERTSCYGCLRNYRNQFAHQHLQRGPVFKYLDRLFSIWQ